MGYREIFFYEFSFYFNVIKLTKTIYLKLHGKNDLLLTFRVKFTFKNQIGVALMHSGNSTWNCVYIFSTKNNRVNQIIKLLYLQDLLLYALYKSMEYIQQICSIFSQKFFRRALKEAETYECKLQQICTLNPRNRNACRYCRYQKCIDVGMSRQGK